ncbi:MAG: hypothetical protein CBC13_04185 [Planctomycetia bacterium TMED53]|nr:MAG: hypothetical protein CBC13_04185 [Planctomycetia bacterium TMED53]
MRALILSVLFIGILAGVYLFIQDHFKSDARSYTERLVRIHQRNQLNNNQDARPVFIEDCAPEVLMYSNTHFPDIEWENVRQITAYSGAASGGPKETNLESVEAPWGVSFQSFYCLKMLVELTMNNGDKEYGVACLRPSDGDWLLLPSANEESPGKSAIAATLKRLKKSHGIED